MPNFMVTGYQADASEAGDHSAWGNFYEEKGRGRTVMKTEDEGWQKAKSLVRHGDWNSYEVFAQGSHIRLTFHGVEPTTRLGLRGGRRTTPGTTSHMPVGDHKQLAHCARIKAGRVLAQ